VIPLSVLSIFFFKADEGRQSTRLVLILVRIARFALGDIVVVFDEASDYVHRVT